MPMNTDLPVFPCHPETKRPLVENGFKAATTDPDQIAAWWGEHPDALIGIPTGPASGFDVLDIDERSGGLEWLRAHTGDLPATRIHKTRGGGYHILFRSSGTVRNSAGVIAPGVDVRGTGGYVIAWNLHGFDTYGPEELAEWPTWLLLEATRRQAPTVDHEVDLEKRRPPSVGEVVRLLDEMPNTAEVDRDTYVKVMTAARGCIVALEDTGNDADARIAEAAVAWAERNPLPHADEAAKWDHDWSQQPGSLAGWQTLQRVADELIPGRAQERHDTRMQEVRAMLPVVPLPAPLDPEELGEALSVPAWLELDIPVKTRYLGDVIASATKTILVGATGLGKSQLAHGIAAGIASGTGFMHWACDAPAKVLVIDGEMSTRLLKERLSALVRRHPAPIPPGMLHLFAMDRAEELVARYPELGKPGALNTPDGMAFLVALVRALRPKVVIFDNLMSLVTGDQTTEVPWSETAGLRKWLTASGIAQVWLDHTGNDRTRQYGSSTKRWDADAVGIMTDIEGADAVQVDKIQFRLSFSAPHGKSRERGRDNWPDFADYVIAMEHDGWTSTRLGAAERQAAEQAFKRRDPMPSSIKWHEALQRCVRAHQGGVITMRDWEAEGVRMGLTEAVLADDTRTSKQAKAARLRQARTDLVTQNWVSVEGDLVRDLRPDLALDGAEWVPEGA